MLRLWQRRMELGNVYNKDPRMCHVSRRLHQLCRISYSIGILCTRGKDTPDIKRLWYPAWLWDEAGRPGSVHLFTHPLCWLVLCWVLQGGPVQLLHHAWSRYNENEYDDDNNIATYSLPPSMDITNRLWDCVWCRTAVLLTCVLCLIHIGYSICAQLFWNFNDKQ